MQKNDKPKVVVFGDIRLEDVAVELMQRRKDIKWLGSAVTPYEYIETDSILPKKDDKEQVGKEEAIHEVINNGHGLVLVSEVSQIANDWLRKLIRKPVTGEEKTIVVVGGARGQVWDKVFATLRNHNINPKEVQWFITVNLCDVPTKTRHIHGVTGVDLYVEIEPVLDYVKHIVQVRHDCIGEMAEIRDDVDGADDTEDIGSQEGGNSSKEIRTSTIELCTPAISLVLKNTSDSLGVGFTFGEMLPNGMIKVTDQEEAHIMLDNFVNTGGGLTLVGDNPMLLEKQLVKYIPKEGELHAMLGNKEDIERLYHTHDDIPCMSVVVEETDVHGFYMALKGVQDVCSHVSALQVDSENYWNLVELWGMRFLDNGANVRGGSLTMSLEEYGEVLNEATNELHRLRGQMDKPPAEIVGALESMVVFVGDDGQLELIGLPAIAMHMFLYEMK